MKVEGLAEIEWRSDLEGRVCGREGKGGRKRGREGE